MQLEPGSLHVEFEKAEELLAKLFALSKDAANDFDAFRSTADRNDQWDAADQKLARSLADLWVESRCIPCD